jgi:chromosome segregation ATPase
MENMCRKLFLIALLGGAGLWAYGHFDVKNRLEEQQSLEERIRKERERLPELDAEIRRFISVVAAREAELDKLDREIARLEKELTQARQAMVARNSELRNGDATKVDAERKRGLRELNRLADTVDRLSKEIEARKDQREAFAEALSASHDELVAYQNEKRTLETELAEIDAQLAHLRVDEIKHRVHFDRSTLAEASARISKLRDKVEVRQKERELHVRYLGEPSQTISTPTEEDVFSKVERLSEKK